MFEYTVKQINSIDINIDAYLDGKPETLKFTEAPCLTILLEPMYITCEYGKALGTLFNRTFKYEEICNMRVEPRSITYFPRLSGTNVPVDTVNEYLNILQDVFPEVNTELLRLGKGVFINGYLNSAIYINTVFRFVRAVEENPEYMDMVVLLYNHGVEHYAALIIGWHLWKRGIGSNKIYLGISPHIVGHHIFETYSSIPYMSHIKEIRTIHERKNSIKTWSVHKQYEGTNEFITGSPRKGALLSKLEEGEAYTIDDIIEQLPMEVMRKCE